jgi:hypothetical protein
MAKSDSLITLRGSIGGLTFVKSRAYGDHVRAKRGTHKKAEVNGAFKTESEQLQRANVPAKILKDAIEPYRQNMPGGLLWQRLVSLFRKQLKDLGAVDFTRVGPFEIHSESTLARLIDLECSANFDETKLCLHVELKYFNHPRFRKAKCVDGYKFTVIVIFPNLENKSGKTASVSANVVDLKADIVPLQFAIDVPPKSKNYIVCIKLEGCTKGIVANMRTTNGLCVMDGGVL